MINFLKKAYNEKIIRYGIYLFIEQIKKQTLKDKESLNKIKELESFLENEVITKLKESFICNVKEESQKSLVEEFNDEVFLLFKNDKKFSFYTNEKKTENIDSIACLTFNSNLDLIYDLASYYINRCYERLVKFNKIEPYKESFELNLNSNDDKLNTFNVICETLVNGKFYCPEFVSVLLLMKVDLISFDVKFIIDRNENRKFKLWYKKHF